MQYVGAYLVEGGSGTLEALLDRLEKEKVITRSNPDLFLREYKRFGIDDAHDIRSRALSRPVAGTQRVFAIFVPGMTSEAQNALLKIIEEPAANAVFFIITPSPGTLLPTIRSRVQTLEMLGLNRGIGVKAEDFLAAPPLKRIEMLKPLYDTDEDGRDIGGVIAFLQDVEKVYTNVKPSVARDDGLRALYRARAYVGDKGSLLKALLEQFALLAPKI